VVSFLLSLFIFLTVRILAAANYFHTFLFYLILRLIFVLLIFTGGLGIIAYIILAIVVPVETTRAVEPDEIMRENMQEIKKTAESIGKEFQQAVPGEESDKNTEKNTYRRSVMVIGILLIVIGAVFLFANLTDFWAWLHWQYIWPIILIAIGILILFSRRRE